MMPPGAEHVARSPSRSLRALWYDRPLRIQLLIVFIFTELVAAAIASAVIVYNARTSTRVEIAASMRLAELLIGETIGALEHVVPADQFLSGLPLQQRFFRHVRISVVDAAGQPVLPRAGATEVNDRRPAPTWFAALIAPSPDHREIAVIVKGQRIGSVFIAGEPADEIAESWANMVSLGLVALAVNVAVIAILYVLFGRVLGPLIDVARGLGDLERRHYDVRLPRPQPLELAAITDRFNALAEALDLARAENAQLVRRLVTAQDDERRKTAMELHDEVGPCLFGLKANAASIAAAAGKLSPADASLIQGRAGDMLAIIERLQALNRSLLKRLRPMALGHVPLRDILNEVVSERARQHPEFSFSFSAGRLRPGYGDSIDLAVYRCLQESLTNAMRHAGCARVEIGLCEAADRAAGTRLVLTVKDDGRGIDPTASAGLGLTGIHERVRMLGGTSVIEGVRGGGTQVRVGIPVEVAMPTAASRP
jgi:two-component system sensor histidine kinase UhpB